MRASRNYKVNYVYGRQHDGKSRVRNTWRQFVFVFLNVFVIVFVFSIFTMRSMTFSQNCNLWLDVVFGPLFHEGREGRGRGGVGPIALKYQNPRSMSFKTLNFNLVLFSKGRETHATSLTNPFSNISKSIFIYNKFDISM